MKLKTKIVAVSTLLGLFAGTLDTIVDYLFFYKDESFLNLMIFDVPDPEKYTRFGILFTFIIFGIVVGEITSRLEEALSNIKVLRGFLPVCSSCKRILDEKGYWRQFESYIREHSEVEFGHGICEECGEKQLDSHDWYYKDTVGKDNISADR